MCRQGLKLQGLSVQRVRDREAEREEERERERQVERQRERDQEVQRAHQGKGVASGPGVQQL